MPETLNAFLIVGKEGPYRRDKIVPLRERGILLGRRGKNHQPDISFDSLYVSRRHADINYSQGRFTITDLLGSRYGTKVNGHHLAKSAPCLRLARLGS